MRLIFLFVSIAVVCAGIALYLSRSHPYAAGAAQQESTAKGDTAPDINTNIAPDPRTAPGNDAP